MIGRSLNANKTTANILLKSFCLRLREIDRTVKAKLARTASYAGHQVMKYMSQ